MRKRTVYDEPLAVLAIVTAFLMASSGCNRAQNQPAATTSSVQASTAKRYHMKGKVVSVDKESKMAIIDGEAIPGFMDAMTMPYLVKPESELEKLAPGDQITADVVVQDDSGWLENIVVTGHAPAQKSK